MIKCSNETERKVQGTKGPRNFGSPGTKVPENERAWERKFQGTFVPGNEKSREQKFSIGTIRSSERKVLGTKSPGTGNCHPFGPTKTRWSPLSTSVQDSSWKKKSVIDQCYYIQSVVCLLLRLRGIMNPTSGLGTSWKWTGLRELRKSTSSALDWVPGLFVPKTFRSQERIVPMGNFRSRDFSFPVNESSLELSFPGLFVLGNFRSRGKKVPGNFRSLALSFRGTFVPPTILQGIGYERRQLY